MRQSSKWHLTPGKVLVSCDDDNKDSYEVPETSRKMTKTPMVTPNTKAVAVTGRMNSQSTIFDHVSAYSNADGGNNEKKSGHEDEEFPMSKERGEFMSRILAQSICKYVIIDLHSLDFKKHVTTII